MQKLVVVRGMSWQRDGSVRAYEPGCPGSILRIPQIENVHIAENYQQCCWFENVKQMPLHVDQILLELQVADYGYKKQRFMFILSLITLSYE